MATSVFRIGSHTLTYEDLPARSGIRWAVGHPQGRRSSTWRLWGDKKGDVYLAMRSLGGVLKVSIHRDRRCSIGFTKEYESTAQTKFGSKSRHWERWRLPDTEVVRVAQVVIPNDELSVFSTEEAIQMRWLPAPGAGNAIVVSVFIAEPPDKAEWRGPELDGHILGIMSAPSRFTWVVYGVQTLDTETLRHIEESRARARHNILDKGISIDDPALRVALWGYSPTPANMYFIELCATKPYGGNSKNSD